MSTKKKKKSILQPAIVSGSLFLLWMWNRGTETQQMVPHLFFHISLQGLPPIYLIINFCLFYPGASLRPSLLLHLPSSCPNLGPYQLIPHLDPKVIILKSNNIDHFTHLLKLLHWQVHVSWSTQNLSGPRPWLPLQSSHCSRRVSPTLHEPMCLCAFVFMFSLLQMPFILNVSTTLKSSPTPTFPEWPLYFL